MTLIHNDFYGLWLTTVQSEVRRRERLVQTWIKCHDVMQDVDLILNGKIKEQGQQYATGSLSLFRDDKSKNNINNNDNDY